MLIAECFLILQAKENKGQTDLGVRTQREGICTRRQHLPGWRRTESARPEWKCFLSQDGQPVVQPSGVHIPGRRDLGHSGTWRTPWTGPW